MTKSFKIIWAGTFIVSFAIVFALGLIPRPLNKAINWALAQLMQPNAIAGEESIRVELTPSEVIPAPVREAPVSIEIPSIGIKSLIVTPDRTDIDTLDSALSEGVVYYPGSGLLGENANVLLFGHSSNLKYVRNQAFKALTGLQKVLPGDVIIVEGTMKRYVYRVDSLRLADKNEELVQFDSYNQKLTISTCDTFGKKDDRYIVEASFVESLDKADEIII